MARVSLSNITKIFPPNTIAVRDVSFTVYDGEFFVLLGPSGCGKTTTLRIIAGLEKPTKGKVFIDDKDVTELPPRERDVAMVFQTWALYPHMKVYDNIAFPLKLRKMPKNEIDKKVKGIAKILKIDHLLNRYPKQLSGGQQQRVALARALVRNPKVWLLDEPLSNLDALLRVYMRAELKKLQKELKVTTIYVTHDQVEAMTLADRIAVMNLGKVLQIGNPHEIYHKPKTKFIAGFIGSPPMNFILMEVIQRNNKVMLKKGYVELTLPKKLGDLIIKNATSNEVLLGIRPEDISLAQANEQNTIKAEVYVIEPLGSETIVNAKVNDVIIKIKVPKEIHVESGSNVWLKINLDKIHVFDPKTEEAII